MKSGWKINFIDGYNVILNDKAYKKYQKETPKEYVSSEEHWFIFDELVNRYPDTDLIEL